MSVRRRSRTSSRCCGRRSWLNAFSPEVDMGASLEVLEAEVLSLSRTERSHLLERLVVSLASDPEIEEAWDREAERRDAELESGAVTAVPGQEAVARLRSRLSR